MKDMRDSKEKVKFDIKNIESKVLKQEYDLGPRKFMSTTNSSYDKRLFETVSSIYMKAPKNKNQE